MDAGVGFIYNVRARAVKFVDDAVYKFFVARYRRGGQNDKILRSDLDFFVIRVSHSVKRGHRFALTSGGYDDEFFGIVFVYLVDIDDNSVGNLHISELAGNFENRYHASSADGDFSAERDRGVYDLLNSVNI